MDPQGRAGTTPNRDAAPKFARPSSRRACARTRLFQHLDRLTAESSVWITACAGSGKTTLVSTWVDRQRRPVLWYRVDARDCAPASFLHDLRRAAITLAGDAAHGLAPPGSEFVAAPEARARGFFEQLFACLPRDTCLVFDNCERLGTDSATTGMLALALRQLPTTMTVVMISREPPAPVFARLQANGRLALITDADLRLEIDEARAIARHSGSRVTEAAIDALYQQAAGWAAGITLLLEQADVACTVSTPTGSILDYFAGEVIAHLDDATLDTLLRSAWLPQVSAAALADLCADADAPDRIAALCNRNYFVAVSASDPALYEYHPLFRAALLREARTRWRRAELDTARRRAATILAREGRHEDALELLLENGDLEAATTVIEREAQRWLAEGRGEFLATAITSVPDAVLTTRPKLLYWLAACRMPADPVVARRCLALAAHGFHAAGDVAGELLAHAAIAESLFHSRSDFHLLDAPIDAVEALLARDASLLEHARHGPHLTAAMFCAYMVRRPGSPRLAFWTRQAERLVAETDDAAARLGVATQLVAFHAWWTGDSAKARMFVDAIEPSHQGIGATALERIAWNAAAAIQKAQVLDFAGSIASAERGLAIAHENGIRLWDFVLLAQRGWGLVFQRNDTAAAANLERMAAVLEAGHHLDACQYHFQNFILALNRDDQVGMRVHAQATWESGMASGNPWTECLGLIARARTMAQDRRAAMALLATAHVLIGGEAGNCVTHAALLARAELAATDDAPQAGLDELRDLMTFASAHNIVHSFWHRDAVLAELCVRALEHGIETAFVQRLVRLRRLAPRTPPVHVDDWPWAVDIGTLGHFEVRVDGAALGFARKSQKRTLALLKTLIALGAQEVPETRAMDLLWPDADGDAAQRALATAIHRLRQLIGAESITHHDGLLGLDATRCRVDLQIFERHLTAAEATRADPAAANAALSQALKCYGGPFLPADSDLPAALLLRARLHTRLLRCAVALADRLHDAGQFTSAADVYERSLSLDDLVEDAHRGLMLCHLDAGHPAAGLVAYRRCREALRRGLDITPSADTEAVRQRLENA